MAEELKGQPGLQQFKTELICIVDTLDAGMLVFRNNRRSVTLPRMGPFHTMKRMFEQHYLKAYRTR